MYKFTRRKTIMENNGQFTVVLGNASDRAFANGTECPLFDVVVALQYAAMVHQYNHWFASGPAFLALHELYAEGYGLAIKDADAVAERALMRNEPLSVKHRLAAMVQCDSSHGEDVNIKDSIDCENCIVECCEAAIAFLQNERGAQGTLNLLQGICDQHMSLIYKLSRTAEL